MNLEKYTVNISFNLLAERENQVRKEQESRSEKLSVLNDDLDQVLSLMKENEINERNLNRALFYLTAPDLKLSAQLADVQKSSNELTALRDELNAKIYSARFS
jgi:hypothetical protein